MMSLWMCMCLDLIRSRNFIILIHMQHCDLFSSLWFYDNCSNNQLLIGILAVLLFPFPRWHLCIMCIILKRLLVRSLMQMNLIKISQTIMQSKQQRTSWSCIHNADDPCSSIQQYGLLQVLFPQTCNCFCKREGLMDWIWLQKCFSLYTSSN